MSLGVKGLNAELIPSAYLLALLGGATIVVVSRLRVNGLSRRYDLMMLHTDDVQKCYEHYFSLDLTRRDFFGRGDNAVCHSADWIFVSGS